MHFFAFDRIASICPFILPCNAFGWLVTDRVGAQYRRTGPSDPTPLNGTRKWRLEALPGVLVVTWLPTLQCMGNLSVCWASQQCCSCQGVPQPPTSGVCWVVRRVWIHEASLRQQKAQ
jgi:hypothetical protein